MQILILLLTVKLQSGGVAIFSPVALTDEVKKIVADLGGDVKYIAALDIEHHIFLGEWYKAYPGAKVLAPEGLLEKRKKQGNENVPFSSIFTEKNRSVPVDAEFDAEFESEYFASHINKELVFLHKPSKTLIEADLMFNLPATEQFSKAGGDATSGILTKLFSALQNTQGTAVWQKRMIWYGTSAGNRPDFNKSAAKVATWDFERIIPCHGDVIETGGKGIFEKVFGWHLEAFKLQNKTQ
jgi:hypothetical protein